MKRITLFYQCCRLRRYKLGPHGQSHSSENGEKALCGTKGSHKPDIVHRATLNLFFD